MKVTHFRIRRFRSIDDTGWVPFSPDRITALVGQNESGKSSVLDALHLLSSEGNFNPDDARLGQDDPEALLRLEIDDSDLAEIAEGMTPEGGALVRGLLCVQEPFEVCASVQGGDVDFGLSKELLARLNAACASGEESLEAEQVEARASEIHQALKDAIWPLVPEFVLFREDGCQLPNRIDISGSEVADAPGKTGATNFLAAAELSIAQLLSQDDRARSTTLSRAFTTLTGKLQKYWSQVLGTSQRIRLECELLHYPASAQDKAGRPYLVFWVCDGSDKHCPSQRSKGTRWFLSFFLQLIATQKSKQRVIYLLDEPGAYLHASAQRDVVKLIESLAEEMSVVYTTHSPYLLEQHNLHRVVAVERVDLGPESVTRLRRGLELAAASALTLAPVLSLIGVDLSHQQVIKKDRNVLLEEVSAYYYLSAFKILLSVEEEINLVAASGVDNVRLLADLFVAWGLDYVVLVDDDPHGKRVRRDIKQKWSLSDQDAARKLRAFDGCEGVEDLFDPADFRSVVAPGLSLAEGRNSSVIKALGASKPMVALDFYRRCRSGEVSASNLSTASIEGIRIVMSGLVSALGTT